MTTCSGTQYHPYDPTPEMKFTLDNLIKLLERLTTLMDNMEQELGSNKGR